MKISLKILLLAMLVFTCSSRLLTEAAPAVEEKKEGEAEVPPATDTPAEEKKEGGDAPKEEPAAGTSEVKPEAEAPKADAKHPVAHKKDEPIHHGFHKADKTVEPRGKKFYILMAVSVLMIGAVCSAFILGKKKE